MTEDKVIVFCLIEFKRDIEGERVRKRDRKSERERKREIKSERERE